MPTSLLDLPDDVLVRIAHYVHQDTYVPFPSLDPHFENFRSPIDPGNNKDFLNLRNTCKRTYIAIPLQGLHWAINSWEAVQTCLDQSACFKNSIRRLILCIGNYRTCKTNHDAIAKWKDIIALIVQLGTLEELIVEALPLCLHKPVYGISINVYLLRKIHSQAFHTRCTETRTSQDAVVRREIHQAFDCPTRSAGKTCPVVSLYVKGPGEEDVMDVLGEIAVGCPMLEDLYYCSSFCKGERSVVPRISLVLPTTPSYDQGTDLGESIQEMKIVNDLADTGQSIEEVLQLLDSPSTSQNSLPLFDVLAKFKCLKNVDCHLQVELNTSSPQEVVPEQYQPRAAFLEAQCLHGITEDRRISRINRINAAIREAAEIMVYRLPTLQSGWLWAWDGTDEEEAGAKRRWHWYRDSLEDGNLSEIRFNPYTERIPLIFLDNSDGTTQKKYESDAEE